MEGIEVVSLDAGGTLLEPWPSVGAVYSRAVLTAGLAEIPSLELDRGFAAAWKGRGGFDYSRGAWARLVEQAFSGLTTAAADPRLFEAAYSAFARPDAWRVFPEVRSVLQTLRGRGLRLIVLSNWDERLGPLLDSFGFAGEFEFVLTSTEVGVPKPDRFFFEAACTRLGVAPSAILHVGDSWREDVAGALGAGWRALWLDRRGEGGRAGSRITSLDELLRLQW